MATPTIRDVTLGDAAAIAAIYRPIVETTIISFEETAPDTVEIERRITYVTQNYPWLVAEHDETLLGYAYAGRFRERAAYRHSVEVTVYIAQATRRTGVGKALYAALFTRLADAGYHRAFAGISMPNDASVGLHRALGFEPVGTYREAGRKFDRWIDVSWWQRELS